MKLKARLSWPVIFKANGEVVVQNVVQGFGHGLDEMAVKAAQHIKYKPQSAMAGPWISPRGFASNFSWHTNEEWRKHEYV